MSQKGAATRERILDAAQAMVLDRGFSAMSVDRLIDALGVTKGAFFHHFRSKSELAGELITRYAESDKRFFNESLARAEALSHDPLQQVLILVGLYEELFDSMSEPYPGCLLASYVYEIQLFDTDVRDTINGVFLDWRMVLGERLEQAARVHPPRHPVDIPALADEFTVIIEGAFILAKSLRDPKIVGQQLRHYKNYLELLFAGT